jgi:hypothetical protein
MVEAERLRRHDPIDRTDGLTPNLFEPDWLARQAAHQELEAPRPEKQVRGFQGG